MEELLGALGLGLGATLGFGVVRTVGAVLSGMPMRGANRPTAFTHTSRDGQRYYLHRRTLALNSGRTRHLLYFARDLRPSEVLPELPAGYDVVEFERTGMPLLKRASASPKSSPRGATTNTTTPPSR
jgi:hypothetical protein